MQPSFYVSAFARGIVVLVEDYQLKLLDRLIIKNQFFQKISFSFQVCYLIDLLTWNILYIYNFLKTTKLISSYFSKKYHFIKVDSFKLYISIIKSETPTLSLHLPKSYISQVNLICILCCHCLYHFSSFSGSHFESIMVNSQRLRIDTCYFYLGKLIHFRIKMPLLIGDLSWYFWKWQLAYLEYLCDIELSRIYFQISLFLGKNLCFTELSTQIHWNTRLAAFDVFHMFTQFF